MTNKILTIVMGLGLMTACSDKGTNPAEDSTRMAPDFTLAEVMKPIFFDYTSTGCPGCGSWGAPTFEQIAKDQGKNLVPLAIHIKYGDPMITEASNAIAANRIGQRYTPQLWVNNSNGTVLNGNSIDGTGSRTKILKEIDSIKTESPVIAVGLSSVINDNTLTVRYKTKALQDLTGEYFLAIYVMEDGILYKQSSGATDPFEHNYVIRTSNSGGFGTAIEASNLVKDANVDSNLDFEINAEWDKEKLSATIVVWKKEGSTYNAINAYSNNF